MESLRTKDPQKPVEEPPKITGLKELWTWIESFIPSKNNNKEKNRDTKQAELRIAQLRQICQKLGSPQQQFRSVHVAGSKGKGQTASYIASGLAALDFRVGLFRSPHIHDYRERIQLLQLSPKNPDSPRKKKPLLEPSKSSQNEASDKPELRPLYEYFADNQAGSSQAAAHEKHPERSVHCLDITQTLLEQGRRLRRDLSQFRWAQEFSAQTEYDAESYLPIHFFAVLTLLAYRSFAALKCDWAVIETGIGGRLCPTNIICPELSVLTPIELEHTELLGETLEQIATEKAHIIKKKRPCVSATQKVEVQTVLRSFCAERQSPLYFFEHLQSCQMPQNPKPSHSKLEFPAKFPEWARPFLQPRHFACHLKLREANTDNSERPNQSPKHDKPDSKDFVLRLKACSSTQIENLQLALLALLCLEQQGAFATTRHDKTDIWPNISQSVQKSVESVPGRFSCYWHETDIICCFLTPPIPRIPVNACLKI